MSSSALDPLTVILVTYNSQHVLPQALPLLRQVPHVIVVDNGSGDKTLSILRHELPNAIIYANPRNVGFGRANNQALNQVTTPFALLLNPDCQMRVCDLEALLTAAREYPDAALFSPKLYDAPGELGRCFRPAFYKPQPIQNPDTCGDLCADFLSGAALMLRMETLRQVGFFDPWFFLYMEDDDLCERTRRAGHALVLVHAAIAHHQARRSSAPSVRLALRRDYCLTLSKFYIQRKYFGSARAFWTGIRVLTGSFLVLPIHLLSLNQKRIVRTLARIIACLMAPIELSSEHCLQRNPLLR